MSVRRGLTLSSSELFKSRSSYATLCPTGLAFDGCPGALSGDVGLECEGVSEG
jgi:hypothetical protein